MQSRNSLAVFDVAVLGGGMAGMATAARLQAKGLRTIVLEAHGQPGGCAGFYRRKGFSFDVGATTLVDFEPGGVGGELLEAVGIGLPPNSEALPGYVAWLPDRSVVLHRDTAAWMDERLRILGSTPQHTALWKLLDNLARAFWRASRRGVKMPIRSPSSALAAFDAVGVRDLPLIRYARWTVGDALRSFGLEHDRPLVGLLSMLIEDTVHGNVDEAPLINAALGITIRGAGLTRPRGGMRGFWAAFTTRYAQLGGVMKVGWRVDRIERLAGHFVATTRKGTVAARQVVCALPAALASQIAPALVERDVRAYLRRDRESVGGAIVVFLGVPEAEVADQPFTHHQLLQCYDEPLGYGNNMFISVSAADDTDSAPPGHRTVMISTHCDLSSWEGLDHDTYDCRKRAAGERLLTLARRVYPALGDRALVYEIATPRTYERFTSRPRGAVGGFKQTLANANQNAIPHDLGPPGFWLVGDTTWPGLGTVACVLGSRIVADGVLKLAGKMPRRAAQPQPSLGRTRRLQKATPAARGQV